MAEFHVMTGASADLCSLSQNPLHLHYARAQDLDHYLGMLATEGELFVQFWSKPDDALLELVIEDQGDVDVVPAEQSRFL